MRTLYLRRGLASQLPNTCAVLHVTTLLRELIIEAVRIGKLRTQNRVHRAIRDLIVHHVHDSSHLSIFVTLPSDSRALAVARTTMADQPARRSLSELCATAGVGVRTVQRAFRREVGLSFESWRRQARLMKAIELLVSGHSVKEVAYEAGYRRTSAFVEMFRHTMGTTPKMWTTTLNQTTGHAGRFSARSSGECLSHFQEDAPAEEQPHRNEADHGKADRIGKRGPASVRNSREDVLAQKCDYVGPRPG